MCLSKESLKKNFFKKSPVYLYVFLFHSVQSVNTKLLPPVLFPRKNTPLRKHSFAFFARLLQYESKMIIDNLVIYISKYDLT